MNAPLTEQEIVDRAAERENAKPKWWQYLIVLYWLAFFLVQAVLWVRDRWRWMKWFSWQ